MTEEARQQGVTRPTSGSLYQTATRYWPRIAAGLVATVGILEWVVGGITSNGALEFYVFAWASITGGIWFLSERVETALSQERRAQVAQWVCEGNLQTSLESTPAQFALLFDRIFGKPLFSRRGFNRSCVASLLSLAVVLSVVLATGIWQEGEPLQLTGGLVLFMLVSAVIFNFFPDYLSLMETRWAIGWMVRSGKIAPVLLFDLAATAVISLGTMCLVVIALSLSGDLLSALFTPHSPAPLRSYLSVFPSTAGLLYGPLDAEWHYPFGGALGLAFPVRVFFLTAFFTSVWLWLYAASVVLSRVLVQMSGGVGFLLKIADVERGRIKGCVKREAT